MIAIQQIPNTIEQIIVICKENTVFMDYTITEMMK